MRKVGEVRSLEPDRTSHGARHCCTCAPDTPPSDLDTRDFLDWYLPTVCFTTAEVSLRLPHHAIGQHPKDSTNHPPAGPIPTDGVAVVRTNTRERRTNSRMLVNLNRSKGRRANPESGFTIETNTTAPANNARVHQVGEEPDHQPANTGPSDDQQYPDPEQASSGPLATRRAATAAARPQQRVGVDSPVASGHFVATHIRQQEALRRRRGPRSRATAHMCRYGAGWGHRCGCRGEAVRRVPGTAVWCCCSLAS